MSRECGDAMRLRDLKEWLDSKSESSLDEEIVVSDRMWADDERDIYPIVRIGLQATDTYKGYVLLVLSQQLIDVLNDKDELKKKIEEMSKNRFICLDCEHSGYTEIGCLCEHDDHWVEFTARCDNFKECED